MGAGERPTRAENRPEMAYFQSDPDESGENRATERPVTRFEVL